ncbi:MAG: hypothetical protein DHS20C09_11380 [marine bacterium B5-7]|nr:MAG: hypothetical protein DHS20C09_11380 [marine bacterium B5-7]
MPPDEGGFEPSLLPVPVPVSIRSGTLIDAAAKSDASSAITNWQLINMKAAKRIRLNIRLYLAKYGLLLIRNIVDFGLKR